ncbi:hypothetical protein [Spiroplasma clarkii]|uniref:hypothetical protein n=1 Tax=Spiroplasma clarkii TaxID=2139 RepID=UPI0011BAB88B|nr:hypothetical protein [Spiroplasma clarkii]
MRSFLHELFEIHVQALTYDNGRKKNVLYFHHKNILDEAKRQVIEKFIKIVVLGKFKIYLPVLLADYKQVWTAERTYTKEMFLTAISNCLKNKETYLTPPLTKKSRKKLQEICSEYSSIWKNSRDNVAGKQIKIKYKARK